MDRQAVEQPWGNAGSYSVALRCGDLIFTSGQLGAEPRGADVPFRSQVETALERLLASIAAAGGGRDTIIKINAYLASMDDFREYDTVYRLVIPGPLMPCRTTVQVGAFTPPVRIEVDAIAGVRGSGDGGARHQSVVVAAATPVKLVR